MQDLAGQYVDIQWKHGTFTFAAVVHRVAGQMLLIEADGRRQWVNAQAIGTIEGKGPVRQPLFRFRGFWQRVWKR